MTGPEPVSFTVDTAVGPVLVAHGGAGRVTVWGARASDDEVGAVVVLLRERGLTVLAHAGGTAETGRYPDEVPSE